MKRKLLLLMVVIPTLMCLFAFASSAKITIYAGADSSTEATEYEASSITLTGNTEANETVTVYFTDDGRAWKAGETVTFTTDTNLYTIECSKIASYTDWNNVTEGNYILTSHLDFNFETPKADGSGGQGSGTRHNNGGPMNITQGSTVRIFFNGYTIGSGNRIAFSGKDVSIYLLGKGILNSYWGGIPMSLRFTANADSTILVGKEITALSDWTNKIPFMGINEFNADSKLDFHFYGSYTKGQLISQNATPATGSYNVYLHDGCTLNFPSSNDGGRLISTATTPIANIVIDGGTYTFTRENLFVDNADLSRLNVRITGGTFNFSYKTTATQFEGYIDPLYKAKYISELSFTLMCNECAFTMVLGDGFKGLANDFTIVSYCPNCKTRESKEVKKVFEALGYSIKENGEYGIIASYQINKESLAEYEKYLQTKGKTLEFGVFMANSETFGENNFILANGSLGTQYGFKTKITDKDYNRVDCIITDFTSEETTLPLIFSLYTIEGNEISYIQRDGEYAGTATQGGITLNVVTFERVAEILGKTDIEILPPPSNEDE